MSKKIRVVFSIEELLDEVLREVYSEWEIISVVDEHGNTNSTECDIIVEVNSDE